MGSMPCSSEMISQNCKNKKRVKAGESFRKEKLRWRNREHMKGIWNLPWHQSGFRTDQPGDGRFPSSWMISVFLHERVRVEWGRRLPVDFKKLPMFGQSEAAPPCSRPIGGRDTFCLEFDQWRHALHKTFPGFRFILEPKMQWRQF